MAPAVANPDRPVQGEGGTEAKMVRPVDAALEMETRRATEGGGGRAA